MRLRGKQGRSIISSKQRAVFAFGHYFRGAPPTAGASRRPNLLLSSVSGHAFRPARRRTAARKQPERLSAIGSDVCAADAPQERHMNAASGCRHQVASQ